MWRVRDMPDQRPSGTAEGSKNDIKTGRGMTRGSNMARGSNITKASKNKGRIQHPINSNGEEESAGAVLVRRRPGDVNLLEAYVISMGPGPSGHLEYEIPKGHLEYVQEGARKGAGETWEEAAERELYEETGARKDATQILMGPFIGFDRFPQGEHWKKIQYYVCWCADGGSPIFGHVDRKNAKEPVGRMWVSLTELPTVTFKKKGGRVRAPEFIRAALNTNPPIQLMAQDLPEPNNSTWP